MSNYSDLQDYHSFDNPFAYNDYLFEQVYSREELEEALDGFLYPKASKPSFYQRLINIICKPFSSDDLEMMDEALDDFILPSKTSSKSPIIHKDIVMHGNPFYEALPSINSIYEEAFMIKEVDVVDDSPYQALPFIDDTLMNHDNSSPQYSLVHEDTLVKENIINTSFTTLPLKDEF